MRPILLCCIQPDQSLSAPNLFACTEEKGSGRDLLDGVGCPEPPNKRYMGAFPGPAACYDMGGGSSLSSCGPSNGGSRSGGDGNTLDAGRFCVRRLPSGSQAGLGLLSLDALADAALKGSPR